jgi:hypothetical protein
LKTIIKYKNIELTISMLDEKCFKFEISG